MRNFSKIFVLLFSLLVGCSVDQNMLFSMFGKNGYSFLDLGENLRFIVFNGDGQRDSIIVDARVRKYILKGSDLYVARQPAVAVVSKERGAELKVIGTCEYVKIDTKLRTITSFDPKEVMWKNCI